VQLILEALDRALAQGRITDADRLLRRATGMLEECIADGVSLAPEQAARAAVAAAVLCDATRDPCWGRWIAGFYGRVLLAPPADVSDRLHMLARSHPELRQSIAEMIRLVPQRDLAAVDAAALSRLRDLET
jgi:hypothetical protein